MQLHDAQGKRLYLTAEERLAFMAAAARAARPVRTLCAVLHTTGCRISEALKRGRGHAEQPLWPCSRMTAWRQVTAVMQAADIPAGPHRSPKGLRHGFGVHAISSGVPLNMLSKWMGHATLEVTAIYANALGAEEQGIAARMWR